MHAVDPTGPPAASTEGKFCVLVPCEACTKMRRCISRGATPTSHPYLLAAGRSGVEWLPPWFLVLAIWWSMPRSLRTDMARRPAGVPASSASNNPAHAFQGGNCGRHWGQSKAACPAYASKGKTTRCTAVPIWLMLVPQQGSRPTSLRPPADHCWTPRQGSPAGDHKSQLKAAHLGQVPPLQPPARPSTLTEPPATPEQSPAAPGAHSLS